MSTFKFNTDFSILSNSGNSLHGLRIIKNMRLRPIAEVGHTSDVTAEEWDELSILLRVLPDLIELANLVGVVTTDATGGRLGRLRDQWQKAATKAQDIAGYYKHRRDEDARKLAAEEQRQRLLVEDDQRLDREQRRTNPQWKMGWQRWSPALRRPQRNPNG